jgi:hypothetical protein
MSHKLPPSFGDSVHNYVCIYILIRVLQIQLFSSSLIWYISFRLVCVCVCVYVAYNNDVDVKQNHCSQTLHLTHHQIALHNTSQRKESSLPCRHVALLSMRSRFRTQSCADRNKHSYFQELSDMFLFLTVQGRGHCTSPAISTGYFILLNYMSAGYFVILGCFYVLDSSCGWTIRYTGLYVIGFLALRI